MAWCGHSEVIRLGLVLVLCKIGFAVADNVTGLALLRRGFKKEHLALFSFIDFPLQIVYAIVAGKMCKGDSPMNPVCCYSVELCTWLLVGCTSIN
jgi:hypothetical protein